MTWNDAAQKVLKVEKQPLHYKQLAKKILSKKLVETRSKTPHVTLHASINIENKARREKGIPLRFITEEK